MKSITTFALTVLILIAVQSASISQTQTPKKAIWQSDYSKFVEDFNACLIAIGCDVNKNFKDKPVTWMGVLESVDTTKNIAKVIMTPANASLTDRNGKAGTLRCCAVMGILDIEAWKSLTIGEEVTFTSLLGKDSYYPVFMFQDIGVVMLGYSRLVSKKP